MLPFWYRQMISSKQGKHFFRAEGGNKIVFKHQELFVIGMFEKGYHPVLNIRYTKCYTCIKIAKKEKIIHSLLKNSTFTIITFSESWFLEGSEILYISLLTFMYCVS